MKKMRFLSAAVMITLLLSAAGCGDGDSSDSLSRDNSGAAATTLNAGEFKVGSDVPAGRYVITPKDGESGNFVVYDEALPVVNEILSKGDSGMGVPSVTVDLEKDQSIEIKNLNEVTFTPAVTEMKTSLSAGTWVVGLDIKAGSYVATPAEGESGNFVVYEGQLPKTNEILGGGSSGIGVESVSVTLKNKQVIKISGISQVDFADK